MKRLYCKLIRWIFKKLNIATADNVFHRPAVELPKDEDRGANSQTEDPLVVYLEQERNKKGE